ncbi:dynein light chain roadblock-type 1-like [Bombyx mandarina]|uniref:Dynein light chain roadblock-type 1-like n=1 Tax=Bombyx mandarina TaxID=7092 RepID=A0A6J2K537_BOMMA|nr:dynein light chain roadblock-type 1-like [Bombyx mandarina]
MKIVRAMLHEDGDEWLVNLSAKINNINPVIDRIMEDESVEGVIMTNKDGCPIMTNVNAAGATNYALALHRFGVMVQTCVKEMDPFDAVLVMRLHTKKKEIMVVPDPSFNIIVLQQARQKIKKNSEKQFIS